MSENWSEFKNFDAYLAWFLKQKEISFKAGVFSPKDHSTFTASGLFFYKFFGQIPTDKKTLSCPVGLMNNHRIELDSKLIYGPQTSQKRQGDFFVHNKNFPELHDISPNCWITLSHSCSIPKTVFVNLIPVYFSSKFNKILKIIDDRDWADVDFNNIFSNIESNKFPRFISFPPFVDMETKEQIESERLIADLDNIQTMQKNLFLTETPKFSLSFEGLSYFQCRLSIRYCRDLRADQWDDQRRLGHQ